MAINVNFFRVEILLKNALAYLAEHPSAPEARYHTKTITEGQAIFEGTRTDTDRAYRAWREAFFDIVRAHKTLRRQCDRAHRESREWGLKGVPEVSVPYREPDSVRSAAEKMLQYLEDCNLDAPWVGVARGEIEQALHGARAAMLREEEALARYLRQVRARKVGFEYARDSFLAFFEDIRGELDRNGDDFQRLNPHFY